MSVYRHIGSLAAGECLKLGEFAPGIPKNRKVEELPTVSKPETWTMSVQLHNAATAGKHYDLRLIDGALAHSWAIPKAVLPSPGHSVLAVPQATHTSDYALNFGKGKTEHITKGYGKGSVKIVQQEPVDVYHSTPSTDTGTRVRFNTYGKGGTQEYAIVRTSGGNDLLVNKTKSREKHPHLEIGSKPSLKDVDVSKLDLENTDLGISPKLDGAHVLIDLNEPGRIPRMFSYRDPKSKASGLIEHTHKADSLLEMRVPKELKGTTLRAEAIGITEEGRAIPAKDLAGILNSNVFKGRDTLDRLNATVVPYAFDLTRYKGKPVTGNYAERLELLKSISEATGIPYIPVALEAKEKSNLLEAIRAGQHPLTSEGVIARPMSTEAVASKAKFRPDHDVYVRKIFEATSESGKGTGRAGGFAYSHTPHGPVVGRVGTGFDHEMARDMLRTPDKYLGRVAKVEAEQKYPSGALAKPAFVGWHLDKNLI